ncbi:MAG: hypothetical protein E6G41_18740 [Actinobacteria bacterium]|nr:MAG: hypothetical protein E6G41_18740 [Actinomycetota bacterium]
MSKFTKRRGLMLLGVALSLAVAGIAFAFWTGGGSGTGSGAAANGVSGLTANQTTSLSAMYPGDSAQTISGNFDNPNSGPVYVTSGGSPAVGCDASDFTLGSTTMNVNAQVPTGSGVGSFTGATIKFNNKPANQDACKGVTVNLAYTIA